ncbi:glycerophosphodiester phosphodiesterase [Sphingobacterium endophyticum]|uniref:glycerophosphodiester phosphodiesterase n=1 Tax=Sphingobacterium endophyticum TaxID=2546448 RepID=UPI0012E13F6B|nr:glycerophosphodiester phosphodiesterase family protein [Sphingobacterium endophyticum]
MKRQVLLLAMTIVFHAGLFAQTSIIAHRGAWKNTKVPQNSIASLDHAIEEGCWGSEFDVYLTKDDILVVNHDRDFHGLEVEDLTYQELLAKKHDNGESIPTVEEYLKRGLQQKGTKLIFELKTSKLGKERTMKSVEHSLAIVKKLKAESMVEFIAFDWDACLKFRELNKKTKIHYLNGDKSPAEVKAAKLTGVDYHYTIFQKNPNLIKEFKALKLKTNAWTVNKEEDMKFLIDQKIDFITTDEPELLKTILNK